MRTRPKSSSLGSSDESLQDGLTFALAAAAGISTNLVMILEIMPNDR
jgi:hypothetical protein